MKTFAALLAAGIAALAMLGLSSAPASAHAVLVASDPVDGARLASSPPAVTLTFDEPVRLVPDAAQVIAGDGSRVNVEPARIRPDGVTIEIPLPLRLPKGSYTATWRVASADTHVVAGSISFGVDQDAHAPPTPRDQQPRSVNVAANLVRVVLYAGLVLCLGVVITAKMLWPWILSLHRTRALVRAGWTAVVVAIIGEFGLAIVRSNGGWTGGLTVTAVTNAMSSRTGVLLIVRALLTTVLGVAAARIFSAPSGRVGGLRDHTSIIFGLAAADLAATVAVDGHAGVGADAWLAVIATSSHLLAMSIWLGGLLCLSLIVLPSHHTDNLRRWSLAATGCVGVLILTGVYQAIRQVQPVAALWSTDYGITLCIKLSGVAAMLILAYLGRRRLQAATLRRTVPWEAALGAAVVIVTAVLVAQPPARTTYGPAVAMTAPLADGRYAEIHVDTTRHGPTSIEARVFGPNGKIAEPRSVTATLSSADANIAGLPVEFAEDHTGIWRSTYATLPRPGLWKLQLAAAFTSADAVVTTVTFRAW